MLEVSQDEVASSYGQDLLQDKADGLLLDRIGEQFRISIFGKIGKSSDSSLDALGSSSKLQWFEHIADPIDNSSAPAAGMDWFLGWIVLLAALTGGYFLQHAIYTADFPTLAERDRREVL